MDKKLNSIPRFGAVCPSLFVSVADTNPQPISWKAFYIRITTDEQLRISTERARQYYRQGDKSNYAQLKGCGGAITPAAQMQGGHKAENIVSLTAAVMSDFDHIPADQLARARQAAIDDPRTLLCHLTASGEGLRILSTFTSPRPQAAYIDAWHAANEYYALITGCEYDKSTKDATRLSFLAYDPEAYFNPGCTPFVIGTPYDSHNPTDDELQDPFGLAERIAHSKGIMYVEGSRHHYLLYIANLLNKMGVPQATALGRLAPLAPRGESEAAKAVQYVYGHNAADHGIWAKAARGAGRRQAVGGGGVSATPAARKGILASDIEEYLHGHIRMRFNIIGQRMEVWDEASERYENFTDSRLNSLWRDIERHFGRKVGVGDVRNVIFSDSTPLFNPVQEYFDALPAWHPGDPDYIRQLADTVHTTSDADFFAECFGKWFVGIFAPLLGGSAPNHTILVLVGPQGRYKSTFCEFLLPPALRTYFKCKTNQGRMSKDDRLDLCSNILIEMAELDSMDERELNQLKAIVTATSINERAPYAHVSENRQHICSFCATGNNKQFLTDLTGNRRFLPFEVERIQSPREHPFDYGHIYAQVLYLLRNGFQFWFDADDPRMITHCQQFMEPQHEEELILRYFRTPQRTSGIPEFGEWLSASEILEYCNAHSKKPLSGRKVAQLMRKHGFRSRRSACGQVYEVVKRSPEEIELERRSGA